MNLKLLLSQIKDSVPIGKFRTLTENCMLYQDKLKKVETRLSQALINEAKN